jgi:hypothetical protein
MRQEHSNSSSSLLAQEATIDTPPEPVVFKDPKPATAQAAGIVDAYAVSENPLTSSHHLPLRYLWVMETTSLTSSVLNESIPRNTIIDSISQK